VIDNDINGEKISVITPEITQLILEEQAEISNGNILKIITESRARIPKLLKSHNKHFFQILKVQMLFSVPM
jgi:hypothetical protein